MVATAGVEGTECRGEVGALNLRVEVLGWSASLSLLSLDELLGYDA